ncbi:hypothetical protein Rhal01_02192 [Rubritalea halochordaticola]|uniref:Uncharacterized protein n=1 Tax=Rubritalea halochordaticola TaxID=714537 RepID=A0ABP9V4K3_9BACT
MSNSPSSHPLSERPRLLLILKILTWCGLLASLWIYLFASLFAYAYASELLPLPISILATASIFLCSIYALTGKLLPQKSKPYLIYFGLVYLQTCILTSYEHTLVMGSLQISPIPDDGGFRLFLASLVPLLLRIALDKAFPKASQA